MRLLGAVGALLVGGGLLAGCVIQPTGPLLCQDPAAICDCQDASNRGGVVVRWRIVDSSVGQLLDRGECCCNPDAAPGGMLPQQCGRNGDQCKDAPAWLVRNVRLHIKSITIPGHDGSGGLHDRGTLPGRGADHPVLPASGHVRPAAQCRHRCCQPGDGAVCLLEHADGVAAGGAADGAAGAGGEPRWHRSGGQCAADQPGERQHVRRRNGRLSGAFGGLLRRGSPFPATLFRWGTIEKGLWSAHAFYVLFCLLGFARWAAQGLLFGASSAWVPLPCDSFPLGYHRKRSPVGPRLLRPFLSARLRSTAAHGLLFVAPTAWVPLPCDAFPLGYHRKRSPVGPRLLLLDLVGSVSLDSCAGASFRGFFGVGPPSLRRFSAGVPSKKVSGRPTPFTS